MKNAILTAMADVLVAPLIIIVAWIGVLLVLLSVLIALMIIVPFCALYHTIHPTPWKSWLLG